MEGSGTLQYIVLDLEAVGKTADDDFQEIIEIAAYKVKKVDFNNKSTSELINRISRNKQLCITQEFHSYIRPIYHSLNKKIMKLTNIKEPNLSNAKYFYEVIDEFKKWAGTEETKFICWSMCDKKMLEDNAREHFVNIGWLLEDYIDIQYLYDNIYMNRRSTNLTKAVENQGMHFRGLQHNALDDSFATYMLFRDIPINHNRL